MFKYPNSVNNSIIAQQHLLTIKHRTLVMAVTSGQNEILIKINGRKLGAASNKLFIISLCLYHQVYGLVIRANILKAARDVFKLVIKESPNRLYLVPFAFRRQIFIMATDC